MATNKRIRLGDLLVQKGLITEDQLMRALKEQRLRGTKLGETLISLGFVSEHAIVKILCDQLHIEYVELRNMKLDEAAVYTINETIAKKYNLIPTRICFASLCRIPWIFWRSTISPSLPI